MLGLNSVTSFRAHAFCTKGSASSSLRSPERARITPPLRGTRAQRDDGARPPGAASAHLEPGGGRHSNRHESFQGASVMPHGSHQPARQCALDAPYPCDARLGARGRTDNRARQSAPRLAGNFDPWTSRYSSYLWDGFTRADCPTEDDASLVFPHVAITERKIAGVHTAMLQASDHQSWGGQFVRYIRTVYHAHGSSPAAAGRCTVYGFPTEGDRDAFCDLTRATPGKFLRAIAQRHSA